MPKTKADKRTRLIETAVKLAYRHGFRTTSLADIAEAATVPVGNVYYYFKTKDEIGEAIVEQRLLESRVLQQKWHHAGSPKERLYACVENTLGNRDVLARGGCPIGTLCSELNKDGGPLAEKARVLFAETLAWIADQFRAIGQGDNSRKLAVHLLSALQGVSVLAHGSCDPDLVVMETSRLKEWINTLCGEGNKEA
jgi:AcrR family transcriptional regulator